MGVINTYGGTRLPASLDTLAREIEGTDKKTLLSALEVLRSDKNFWNIPKNEVPKFSQFSSTLSPQVQKIFSQVLEVQHDERIEELIEDYAYKDCKDLVISLLECSVWGEIRAEVKFAGIGLSHFFKKEEFTFPSPLPDLIGTDTSPGPLNTKVKETLGKLEEEAKKAPKSKNPNEELLREKERSEIKAYKKAWDELKLCVSTAPKLLYFPDDEKERRECYQRFVYLLNEAFDALKKEGLERTFFFNDGGIDGISEICKTGWESRIAKLLEAQARVKDSQNEVQNEGQNVMEDAHACAQKLRKSIVEKQLLIHVLQEMGFDEGLARDFSLDVHYIRAVKQWANERYALNCSKEELGEDSEWSLTHMAPFLEEIADSIMNKEYNPLAIIEHLKGDFAQIEDAQYREKLIDELLRAYRKTCLEREDLLIDPLEDLQALYTQLEEANEIEDFQKRREKLQEIRNEIRNCGYLPHFSLINPYAKVRAELRQYNYLPFVRQYIRSAAPSSWEEETQEALALKNAYDALAPEEKNEKLGELISQLQEYSQIEKQQAHLASQKRDIRLCVGAFTSHRADENVMLLRKRVHQDKRLSTFGALLWASCAKLLKVADAQCDQKGKGIIKHVSEKFQIDRKAVLEAVKRDGMFLEYASTEDRADREIVLEAVKQNSMAIRYVGEGLEADAQFIQDAKLIEKLEKKPSLYKAFPQKFKDAPLIKAYAEENAWLINEAPSKAEYDKYAEQETLNLANAPRWVKNCRPLVMKAINQNGYALTYASKELQSDRELVLQAIKQRCAVFIYIGKEFRQDREIVLEAISRDGMILRNVSKELQDNHEIVMKAVQRTGSVLSHASTRLKNNDEVVMAAVMENGSALSHASTRLKAKREIVKAAVQQYGLALVHANPIFTGDREIVLEAVKQNGMALKHASPTLTEDREIVMQAVKQKGELLRCAGEKLQEDREIVMQAVKQNGLALQYANPLLQKDREIVMQAIKQDPLAILYASRKLQTDREVIQAANLLKICERDPKFYRKLPQELKMVPELQAFAQKNPWVLSEAPSKQEYDAYHSKEGLSLRISPGWTRKCKPLVLKAIKQDGLELSLASLILQADHELVTQAIKQNGLALQYADPALQADREIVKAAVKQNGLALQYVDPALQADREIVKAAVKQNGLALQYAKPALQADREIVMAAVKQNGLALQYAKPALQADREIVMEALKENGLALVHAEKELQEDHKLVLLAAKREPIALLYTSEKVQNSSKFILKLAKENGMVLQYVSKNLKDYPKIALQAIKQNSSAMLFVSEKLKNDRNFIKKAMKANGMALEFVYDPFRRDREIVKLAVKQNPAALEYASEEIQEEKRSGSLR